MPRQWEVTRTSGITWQPFSGLVASMTYGNGLTETDSYSLDYEINRLLLQNGPTSLIDRTHTHGDLLNLTGITDAVTPANTQSFSYASTNRLSTASGVYGAYSWSYDGVGNRTQEVLGSTTNTYSYPPSSNRLSGLSGGTTRAFTYDANGNIATDSRSGVLYSYSYNQNNRLKTVTKAGNLNATYTYNAQEQLAIRVLTNMTPSGTIHDVYDRAGNLLMESNGLSTGITREYIWLPGTEIAPTMGSMAGVPRPIAVVDGVNTGSPNTWWVHSDHLNRPVLMTNSAKATVWQATWLPFGAPLAITGTATLDARFPGQWFQLESGLHVNWWRHYDPTTGRYTQPDPLGFVDGPSVYGYAGQSPLSSVDPRGQQVAETLGAAAGTVACPECAAGVVVGIGVGICINYAMSHRPPDCEKSYGDDVDTCKGIGRIRSKRAAALCYATANDRYAACLRGIPPSLWPPLNTWNN